MELLRETSADEEAVRALLGAAFPTRAEARLVDALRTAGDAAVSAVAREGGTVVGHAMLSRVAAPFPALGLAPVTVLPGWQQRGVGTRLIAFALDLARAEGWVGVFALGDPGYYGRFGFSADLARGFRSPYAGTHFMLCPLSGHLPVFSGEVAYAPAFAERS